MNRKRNHEYNLSERKVKKRSETPRKNILDLNYDVFLKILSFLSNNSIFQLRLASKTMKDRCDLALELRTRKITISADGYEAYDDFKLERIIATKSKVFSKTKKLKLRRPGLHFETILCIAKRKLTLESLTVIDNMEIDCLPSLRYHFPHLKKLSFSDVIINDRGMSRLFKSLTNLERLKATFNLINFKGKGKCFKDIGPNLKVIKWFSTAFDIWEKGVHFDGKGNQLTSFTLNEECRTNSEKDNIVDFLIREMPNLLSLKIFFDEIETLNGLNLLQNLKELIIDVEGALSTLFSQPMRGVKKLVLAIRKYDIPRILPLFPCVDDLTINIRCSEKVDFNCTREVIDTLQKLNSLRCFTLIIDYITESNIPNLLETIKALSFVPKLCFTFRSQYSWKIDNIVPKIVEIAEQRKNQKFVFVMPWTRFISRKHSANISVNFTANIYEELNKLMELRQ